MWHRQRSQANTRRVLMITEGTYPYAVGGVSSWCDAVIGGLPEINWDVLPIVAGGKRLRQNYVLPPNAHLLLPIELWSEELPPRHGILPASGTGGESLPSRLLEGLLTWNGNARALTEALVWCRQRPQAIRPSFRSRQTWEEYLGALSEVLSEHHEQVGRLPRYDALEAARLYQALTGSPAPPLCALLRARSSTRPPPAGARSRPSCTRNCSGHRCSSPSTESSCARLTWRRFEIPPRRRRGAT